MAMQIQSNAFTDGDLIPSQFTCDGEGKSPPLHWLNPPPNVQSYVLILDDPDAPHGTWDHWILFNIPPAVTSLKEDESKHLSDEIKVGRNSWGLEEYGGPCPPDTVHRYFFKLYALDAKLHLDDGATSTEVEDAMQGHIIGSAELMGKYEKHSQGRDQDLY